MKVLFSFKYVTWFGTMECKAAEDVDDLLQSYLRKSTYQPLLQHQLADIKSLSQYFDTTNITHQTSVEERVLVETERHSRLHMHLL